MKKIKHITWVKIEMEFDGDRVCHIEMDDMKLKMSDLPEFLSKLDDPIKLLADQVARERDE